ncbi:MAG: glycosyltransferase family 4 protein [Armatimonadota bacterium]
MIDRPLRVLHLDHTARLSGGEIALARMLAAMDLDLVRPMVVLAEDGPLHAALASSGVAVEVEPMSADLREIRKDSVDFRVVAKVRAVGILLAYSVRIARLARAQKIDVIHTNSLKAAFYGALAGRMARIPVVWHIRDHIDPTYLPAPAVRAVRWMAGWLPSHVVANSASTLERVLPATGGREGARATVVHGGIDPPGGGSWPVEAPAPPHGDPPVVGIVGRIARWKGQHVFVDAARRLRDRGIVARYIIVGTALFGEEDYERELRAAVADAGMVDDIEFAGFSERVHETMRSLDVFVHASISPEPFGQVVIEAMAAGVPVVAANDGGVREIVEDGVSGVLVTAGDSLALADAIGGLLSDRPRADAIARAGYARMATRFSAQRTARRMERVFLDVHARR